MAREAFCPIDEHGEIVRRCTSVDDLNGFHLWLVMRDAKNAREKAYRRLSENPAAKDLKNEKSRFIAEVAGEFLGAYLNEATALAESDAKNGKPAIERARMLLMGLFRAFAGELLGSASLRVLRENIYLEELEKDLKMGGTMLAELGEIVSKKTGDELVSSYQTFMKTDECGVFVNGGGKWGDVRISHIFFFAPLIEYLVKELRPVQRAELLGRFFAYLDSGWALADILSSSSTRAELSDAVDLVERDPASANGVNVAEWVARRLGELIKPLKLGLPMRHTDGAQLTSVEMLKSARLKISTEVPVNFEQLLDPKHYGVSAVVSPDGKRVVLSISVGAGSSKKQTDDWGMHLMAVQNSVRDPKFLKEIGAEPGASVSIVAQMSGLSRKKGGVRHPVDKMFDGGLHVGEHEAVLTLMFVSRYLNDALKDEFLWLREIKPIPLGGSMDAWEASMVAASLRPTLDECEAAVKVALCAAADQVLTRAHKTGLKQIKSMQDLGVEGRSFLLAMKTILMQLSSMKADGSQEVADALAAVRRNPGRWTLFEALGESTQDAVVEIKKELEENWLK